MNKKVKTLLASALLISGLATSVYAGTIGEGYYDNKGKTSSVRIIGSGSHILYAKGATQGSRGQAKAKKVNVWAFDDTVATVSVSGTLKRTSTFNAQALTSDGGDQGYYITWSPNEKTHAAYIGITH